MYYIIIEFIILQYFLQTQLVIFPVKFKHALGSTELCFYTFYIAYNDVIIEY